MGNRNRTSAIVPYLWPMFLLAVIVGTISLAFYADDMVAIEAHDRFRDCQTLRSEVRTERGMLALDRVCGSIR
jgi:hypothetical protein